MSILRFFFIRYLSGLGTVRKCGGIVAHVMIYDTNPRVHSTIQCLFWRRDRSPFKNIRVSMTSTSMPNLQESK